MAAGYSFFGAVLAFFGLINGPQVGWAEEPKIALGYAFAGVVCLVFHRSGAPRREFDMTDPIDAADAARALAGGAPSTNGGSLDRVPPEGEPVPA
jgi:AGZA family xanthine/uracil permease-like MFS transporter